MKRMLLMALAASVCGGVWASAGSVMAEKSSAVRSANAQVVQAGKLASMQAKAVSFANENQEMFNKLTKKLNLKGHANTFSMKAVAPKSIDSASATLYEDFEGYTGGQYSNSYLPDGWSYKRTDGILELGEVYLENSPTMTGLGAWYADSYFMTPYEGNASMGCLFLYAETLSGASIAQQEEYLITPQINVANGDVLEFYYYCNPQYLFYLDEEHVNMNTYEWISQEVTATLQVRVSTDNGSKWTTVFDAADKYKGSLIDFLEIASSYQESYELASIDLSSYADQNVKIAFVYVGKDGFVINIDNVAVGQPSVDASYASAGQLFRMAMLEDYTAYDGVYLVPANTDFTWYNTGDGDSFLWSYTDANGENEVSSTDKNMVANYEEGVYTTPVLTAYADSKEGTYQLGNLLIAGGGCEVWNQVSGSSLNGSSVFGSYEPTAEYGVYVDLSFGATAETNLTQLYAQQYPTYGITSAKVTTIGTMYREPVAPYELSRISVLGGKRADFPSDAQYDLAVIRMQKETTAEGTNYTITEDTLAVAHCTGNQVLTPIASEGYDSYIVLPFNLLSKDQFGFEMPATITVNDPILVTVTPVNNGTADWSIWCNTEDVPNAIGYSMMDLETTSSGTLQLGGFMSNLGIFMNLDVNYVADPSGVEDVVSKTDATCAKVAVVGGDFVVTAPEAINAVTVYNVAGQAVAASEVAGTTTVSGQSLAKGVYILRFNDGSSVKVVK